MLVHLANPRGFCAGVERAIEIVERALDKFGAPVYVRHEVVHNRYVVDCLKKMGAVFVEEVDEVPDGATVIFSAHGVAKSVRQEATEHNHNVFDATCPLVTKVHMEVQCHRRHGREVILIGHAGHPEVEGTLGQVKDGVYLVETPKDLAGLSVKNENKLNFVTQTTLSVDDALIMVEALKKRFPNIKGPKKDDICYATQNRQDVIKKLARRCGMVVVVGSPNSSNSNRLREVAEAQGARAYMVDGPEDLQRDWVKGVDNIGVTAGASAPEVLVQGVINRLLEWGAELAEEKVEKLESIHFAIPKPLRSTST